MNSKMVKTIVIVAGLFNIGGVLMFSMFFTNGLPGKYLPEVMGNFGLIGIMLWGLAYCAAAPGIRENRWPALVFAFEKMVYAVSWVWFVCERGALLPQIFGESWQTGLFLSSYGSADFIFGIFFLWVWMKGYN